MLARAAFVAAVLALVAADGSFTWKNLSPDGPWVTEHVSLTTPSGAFSPGQVATVQLSGVVQEFLTGGHVKLSLWEYNVDKAVMTENANYFACHGFPAVCDPCKPQAVVYSPNCTQATAEHFTFTANFTLPQPQAQANYTLSLVSGHYYPKEIVVEVYFFGSKQ